MRGILYGVGVGPGDPELMTLKAVRLIKENDIIAVPGAEVRETVAYKIAVQAVPELAASRPFDAVPQMKKPCSSQGRMERSAIFTIGSSSIINILYIKVLSVGKSGCDF